MKILLAVDDSDFSRAAADAVIKAFSRADAAVHVLHVVDPLKLAPSFVGTGVGPSVPADFAGVIEEWLDQAEILVSQTAKVLASAGFHVSTSVLEGDAKSQILDFAEKWQPNLIVVGSHGRTGIGRFLLGSVSEAIARHARCSVQIVRRSAPLAEGDVPPIAKSE
jgi:nucleotide-binding universal stress UspA family protein